MKQSRRNTAAVDSKGRDSVEKVRMVQLAVCVGLFLSIFIGTGVFPERMTQIQQDMRYLLTSDMDLRGAMEMLGLSFADGNETISELGDFCLAVFGVETEKEDVTLKSVGSWKAPDILNAEIQRLGTGVTAQELSDFYLEPAYMGLALSRKRAEAEPVVEEEEEKAAMVPAAGTVLLEVDYTGRALPNNYTMNQLSLGDLETVTPVLGHLNSKYGYRDHPVNGVYQFHGGVDIGGQKGDPIAAFADGTVEYIGEDKSYGLYLQIDHGNGVKSFYAHCNKLLVSKGDQVTAGERIAEVGSSGTATGPHLHLELKYNRMHMNPAYYLDFLTT